MNVMFERWIFIVQFLFLFKKQKNVFFHGNRVTSPTKIDSIAKILLHMREKEKGGGGEAKIDKY